MLLIAASVVWALVVCGGLTLLWGYENGPGRPAAAPQRWPAGSRITPAADRPTLVMLAHPHCPCTRASVGELARLMARAKGRVSAHVLFLKPADLPDGWEKTDLWRSAAAIPGVEVLADGGGEEARRFGAATSSQVLLYDAGGRLLFSGGITASRGHSGDNAGRAAVESLLTEGAADKTGTFVFGCPLFDENSECRKPANAINRK